MKNFTFFLLFFACACSSKTITRNYVKTIRENLVKHIPNFRTCYPSSNTSEFTQVLLEFTINPDGTVKNDPPIKVKAQNDLDKKIGDCVMKRLTEISFPKNQFGKSLKITQPMNFFPQKK